MKRQFLLLTSLLALLGSFGQDRFLDRSFGNKGRTYLDFRRGNYESENGRQVLLQTDGSYIVIFMQNGYTLMARYNSTGILDKTFGSEGFSEPFRINPITAIQQTNGKIVVLGESFDVARYYANGTLDLGFGTGGKVSTNFGGFDRSTSIAIQGDGKIVVTGWTQDASNNYKTCFALARYNRNGSRDKSFGNGGKVITDLGGSSWASGTVIQDNEKLVVAGSKEEPDISGSDFVLARYNPNGSLDSSFGNKGQVTTDFGGFGWASAVVIEDDEKLVVAGGNEDLDHVNRNLILARYNSDGSLDDSFGKGGKVIEDFGSIDRASSIAIAKDAKILVAMGADLPDNPHTNFMFARFNYDGTLDNTFGTDGKVSTDFLSNADAANSLAIQKDGKIVAIGTAYNPTDTAYNINSDLALARYLANGTLDTTFGNNGKLISYYPTGIFTIKILANQKDGKLVVAGNSQTPHSEYSDFALARYNFDGSLDSSFGKGGKVVTDIGGDGNVTYAAIQEDGKIVVVGSRNPNTQTGADIALVRYNPDGSLDSSFGITGKVLTDFGYTDIAFAIAIQGDGKLIVAGYTGYEGKFTLVRYNKDGSLDNTFGNNGKVITDFGGGSSSATSIAIQDDGKLVVGGNVYFDSTYGDFVLARYNPDGSLDKAFGNGGKSVTDFGVSNDGAFSLAIQTNGKIVQGGYVYDFRSHNYSYALASYNTDGSLDRTFGKDGKLITELAGKVGFIKATNSLALQNDGKMTVAGISNKAVTLARYNPNGSLDSSFGNYGKITTKFSVDNFEVTTLISNKKRAYVGGPCTNGLPRNQRGLIAAYNLEATPSSLINTYTLIDAGNDKDIEELKDGLTINLASLYTLHLNVRANTTPYKVDSVNFTLIGIEERQHTENASPYALFNDDRGNYNNWTPAAGNYTLTATPYLNGVAGTPLTIHFEVTPFLVSSFTLVNADNEEDISAYQTIHDGAIIDLNTLPTPNVNIRANVRPHQVGSVMLNLDGKTHIENGPPYALGGDIAGNYFPMTLTLGSHTLTATPYSQSNGKGEKGQSLTVHFTVMQSAITENGGMKKMNGAAASGMELNKPVNFFSERTPTYLFNDNNRWLNHYSYSRYAPKLANRSSPN
ncbi:hypothetical protein [Segetibacter koreensis]|uniref:hypothetical protein n=1 Tax=Segetibacter koreensis TaxID=398037 RepID=UPI000381067F|nr:hypothetical protein [Segetibacter koreensis]